MKSKKLFSVFMLMLAMTVSSCEKMVLSEGAESEEQPNVVLSVGQFEQIPFDVATRASVLSAVCTRLNFIVYNEAGQRIRQVEQTKTDEKFGQASIYLPTGSYFLVVLAHSGSGNPTSTQANKIGFTNSTGFTDTFFYGGSLEVGVEGVERTLQLRRIVSMVRFLFEDAVPARADRIRFYYEGGSGTLDATAGGWGVVKSKQSQFYDITHEETKFEIYTIPWSGADQYLTTVRVTTYQGLDDGQENIVSEREINNIPIVRNRITVCRGYLFSPVSNMTFHITVSDEWDGTDQFNF